MDIAFLRTHPLTFGLAAAQLKQLGEKLESVSVREGEVLCREGTASRGLFLIESGRLKISRVVDGSERILAGLEAPTVIGEMELVSQRPYAATVTAATDVQGYLFSSDAFASLIESGDAMVSKLMRNIARVLVLRLEASNALLARVGESEIGARWDF